MLIQGVHDAAIKAKAAEKSAYKVNSQYQAVLMKQTTAISIKAGGGARAEKQALTC